ncbi:hypothetical protein Sta7437_0184 [Stanieria cyanosphaera PCC 7437]|uniref:Thylakoid lumen protein n=1 Tax=Stanieria cyanosphaera (strain ATCC 29371 / PCC 7437) TaxID=111780 RepID=K9XQ55_STAC7|nr:hypothetical protein [Stanieria cyanosphaera]AFZ33802.1 hypothetical protein Sta7437_0184 [Stanieria cyanosphaera PCC 7437]
MSNPVIQAFFFGRALAEVLNEKLEESVTNALSDLGKFDAEARENLRQFIEEVQARAEREANFASANPASGTTNNNKNVDTEDLQEMLDQLRAEIASLKAELNKYRNQ